MASNSKKKTNNKNASVKRNASVSKNKTSKSAPQRRREETKPSYSIANYVMPVVLWLVAIYVMICFLLADKVDAIGFMGQWIKDISFGLFSIGAWTIPIFLALRAISYKSDNIEGSLVSRSVLTLLSTVGISALCDVFTASELNFKISAMYTEGVASSGGGVIGALIARSLRSVVGIAGTLIILFALVFIFGFLAFGITPGMIIMKLKDMMIEQKDRLEEREALMAEYRENEAKKRPVLTRNPRVARTPSFAQTQNNRDDLDIDMPLPDEVSEDSSEEDMSDPYDAVINEAIEDKRESEEDYVFENDPDFGKAEPEHIYPETRTAKVKRSESDVHAVDLDLIFGENRDGLEITGDIDDENDDLPWMEESIEIKREDIGKAQESLKREDTPRPEYSFPPITLLKKDTSGKAVDNSTELRTTAEKLVETLKSYRINTRLISISRGPSITRYELSPEVGTKVNSIVNRVDDIALHLASTGVRIVAPIPGMEAVGVEVPNKNVSLVYIRDLFENDEFKNNPSKLNVALGMDVTGRPIYMDIAKMPHLLVAGATGMGKSVCINSTIMSILYKATPDEVKLILIDPKTVEFSMYNGIPHLLVPVVTDPKKAAGTLHWAVNEMERRYELINGARVRNIHAYNEVIKDDPDGEYMPQIVIIIDELADLMLTASKDVDESIRRLSAKARAAGIHLILATQRPTVDVITGTIKSNIPYRIAFATTSGIDSRTILDVGGAEKLIGKGDMLYAATGKSPVRIQGSFVSDDEVNLVADFIKHNSGGANYNESVLESIERESELCGNKKATVLGDGDVENNSGDPLLKSAIEIAVESGKISTSLLQRRLSIGFGRAAKLIDIMEDRGIVSHPDGQKPRVTLWTKEQYMESLTRGNYDAE